MCKLIKKPITKLMAAIKKPTAKPFCKKKLITEINRGSCDLLSFHPENQLIAAESIEKSSSALIKILKEELCKN